MMNPIDYPDWIWLPESIFEECSFVLFRKVFSVNRLPDGAGHGIVAADSRYNLYVNGKLVQRGPAPFDPRYQELDPVDIVPHLRKGKNVIGILVCYFGRKDGTYQKNRPGLMFACDWTVGGKKTVLAADSTWKCLKCSAWESGGPRNAHRALTERFDARQFPYGWLDPDFDRSGWQAPVVLHGLRGKPLAFCKNVPAEKKMRLVPRVMPSMAENYVPAARLVRRGKVVWKISPGEYFKFIPDNAFKEVVEKEMDRAEGVREQYPITAKLPPNVSSAFVFDFGEVMVGYPVVELDAPAGAVIELIFAEVLNRGKFIDQAVRLFKSWSRYTTRAGRNLFESFDYESLRYLTVLVRNADAKAQIKTVGLVRRTYSFSHQPALVTSSSEINRVVSAAVNTAKNVLQDIIVDNVVREREQYCGDMGLGSLAAYYGFGETILSERRLRTFMQGQCPGGFFVAAWPGSGNIDEMFTLAATGRTYYGVGYVCCSMAIAFDVAKHYEWTGNLKFVREVLPKLKKFDAWLERHEQKDGLLPVTGWDWNSVYIDCEGFSARNDKVAVFNAIYLAHLSELRRLLQQAGERISAIDRRIRRVRLGLRRQYWCPRRRLVIDNLPSLKDHAGKLILHDRTIAMSLLYGVVPEGCENQCLELLARPPRNLGLESPTWSCWRLWALARFGRGDAVVRDLEQRWAAMPSVREGNCISEKWNMYSVGLTSFGQKTPKITPATIANTRGAAWCQNATTPLYVLLGDILGIQPLQPGFRSFAIRPQPGSLKWIKGCVHTPRGEIEACITRKGHALLLELTIPAGMQAVLVTPRSARVEGLGNTSIRVVERDLRHWTLAAQPRIRKETLTIHGSDA